MQTRALKFLLHSSNAAYDAATKTFVYNLDRRLANPRTLQVERATFTPVSTLSPMPHVVYMHSAALSSMVRAKHTVVLTAEAHENASDVIAVLEETHTRGRYAVRDNGPVYTTNRDAHTRRIDIYFTDGAGTKLDGLLGTVDHGDAVAALNPTMWLDPDHEASLTAVSAPLVVGGNVSSWASRGVAGVLLNTNANKTAAWTAFGATKSLLYALDSTKMNDTTGVQPLQDQNSTLCMMFKTGTSVSSQANLIFSSALQIYVKSGVLKFKDPSHPSQQQAVVSTTLAVAVATSYRLTVVRTTGQSNTYAMELLQLDGGNAGTLQTDTQNFTAINNLPTDHDLEYGGQYTEEYEYSHFVEIPGVTTAIKTACHDYMAAKYAGTITYVAGEHAGFFGQMKIKTS